MRLGDGNKTIRSLNNKSNLDSSNLRSRIFLKTNPLTTQEAIEMASIYGVSVKNVKCQTDHEGCAMYSADVWRNGKKLGHWGQNYWCGSGEFDSA